MDSDQRSAQVERLKVVETGSAAMLVRGREAQDRPDCAPTGSDAPYAFVIMWVRS